MSCIYDLPKARKFKFTLDALREKQKDHMYFKTLGLN